MVASPYAGWQRFVNAGVLCVWGSVALAFFAGGRVSSYLHPAFHVWVLLSGIALVAMAAGVLFFPPSHACADCCGVEAGDRSPWKVGISAAVLIIPLLVAAAISPSQFGAVAVANRGLATSIADLPAYGPAAGAGDAADPGSYLQKNASGQIVASVVDLLYAANEADMRADFDGKEVEIVGQFFPARDQNPNGDRFSLVRMYVMCCAADARPVAIPVQASSPESFPDMSWVRVTGKVTFPVEGGKRVPLIRANSVEESPQPEESFVY